MFHLVTPINDKKKLMSRMNAFSDRDFYIKMRSGMPRPKRITGFMDDIGVGRNLRKEFRKILNDKMDEMKPRIFTIKLEMEREQFNDPTITFVTIEKNW